MQHWHCHLMNVIGACPSTGHADTNLHTAPRTLFPQTYQQVSQTVRFQILNSLLNFRSNSLFSFLVLFHLLICQICIQCLLSVRYALNTKDMTVNHTDMVYSLVEPTFCEG